jgi:hypothetical protein
MNGELRGFCVMAGLASPFVIPGREACDKIDASINFAPGERALMCNCTSENPFLQVMLWRHGFRVCALRRIPE